MSKHVSGSFNGTAADLYICLGFLPHYVRVWNAEGTARGLVEWNINMARTVEISDGIEMSALDQQAEAVTRTTGISAFYSPGDRLTSTQAGTITYSDGVYLKKDDKDYRDAGDGLVIANWTLGSSTDYTGNWDYVCNTTYIGEGSTIVIGGRLYTIQAVTGNGEAANEVTLNYPAPSGIIGYIGGMYDYIPMIEGESPSDGFKFDGDLGANTADEICLFEAGTYDNF